MELDALQEAYWIKAQGRIELLGESLQRIKEELEGRDLSAVATPKLLELELKMITELKKEFSAPHVMSEQEIEQAMLMRDETESPCNFYNPSPERRTPLLRQRTARMAKTGDVALIQTNRAITSELG